MAHFGKGWALTWQPLQLLWPSCHLSSGALSGRKWVESASALRPPKPLKSLLPGLRVFFSFFVLLLFCKQTISNLGFLQICIFLNSKKLPWIAFGQKKKSSFNLVNVSTMWFLYVIRHIMSQLSITAEHLGSAVYWWWEKKMDSDWQKLEKQPASRTNKQWRAVRGILQHHG